MIQMDQLPELFPLPCQSFMTQGLQKGMVLKFRTFYLKIYDDPNSSAYIVQGYRYDKQNPVIIDKVPWTTMRRYAKQFISEDYLQGMLLTHQRSE